MPLILCLRRVGAVPANSICGLFIIADSAGAVAAVFAREHPLFSPIYLGII